MNPSGPNQKSTKSVPLSEKITKLRKKLSPRRRKIFKHDNPEDRFTAIFDNNFWRNDESFSGCGSTLEYTENLRAELPLLFKKHGVKSVFDAPCGDFNWMRLVVEETGVDYTGGDIVAPLIEQNQEQYGRGGVKFIHSDITKGPLPKCDMMIVRDCLFHLSYSDVLSFLQVFAASEIPLLLTSSHLNKSESFANEDIVTGNFRAIDLFSKPFGFSKQVIDCIADDPAESCNRHMYLFTQEQVAEVAVNLAENLT